MQTIERPNERLSAVVYPAAADDDWAERVLFAALHAHNADLEPRFALADGWERLLAERLTDERATGGGVTLLAWQGREPFGLAMVAGQTDPPLFGGRRWAELAARYVAPAARGTGLLVAAGLGCVRAHGYGEVRLWVTATNAPARRFYAGAGFRPLQEVWSLNVASAAPAARQAARGSVETA